MGEVSADRPNEVVLHLANLVLAEFMVCFAARQTTPVVGHGNEAGGNGLGTGGMVLGRRAMVCTQAHRVWRWCATVQTWILWFI